MPRSQFQKRRTSPDRQYGNTAVSKFINHIMQEGDKSAARKIVYGAFEIMKEKSKKDPVEVFERAIENVAPLL